jgi:hypothetical protein
MAATALAGGIGWMSLGSPVVIFDVLVTLFLVAPLILLSLPRNTLLCERGVAAANGACKWEELVTWELYDAGRQLSLVMRQSGPSRVKELTVETRITRNQEAAIALLRERVPNGRVLH